MYEIGRVVLVWRWDSRVYGLNDALTPDYVLLFVVF